MRETDSIELDLLQRRADAGGFYVNRHRAWDPLSNSGGDLYLQPKKKFRDEANGHILAYATADEIHRKLCELGA